MSADMEEKNEPLRCRMTVHYDEESRRILEALSLRTGDLYPSLARRGPRLM